MNSSFSFSRFGVIRRINSPRCAVCLGGSNVGSWSLNGSVSRYSSMIGPMSSPTRGTGNFVHGPATALHDENVAGSLHTAIASSKPVTITTP